LSGITGDFKTLNSMRKRLTAVSGAPERTAQVVAPLFLQDVQNEFATETNPAGKRWRKDKPVTYKLGTQSILWRSGALYGTIKAIAEGAKVRISLGTAYLKYQLGKGRNPLPKKTTPKKWSEQVRTEAGHVVRKILSGT